MLLDAVEVIMWCIYFISLYFTVFWFLVFIEYDAKDRKRRLRGFPLVSIVIPAYNEEKSILKTLESVFGLDYPKRRVDIIVVNDGSTDATASIVQAVQKTHTNVRLITQKNQGKGVALNRGLELAKGEYYVCLDADSFVEPDALKTLLPEFDSEAKGATNLLQKIQFTEYLVNIFYKKLMAKLDCVHVSPGPFSVYRTAVLREVGGFDTDNLTEDLEMTLRLQEYNYRIKQNMNTVVWTLTPKKLDAYIRQRRRWFKGGFSNAIAYRKMLFNRRWGDFGLIQLPVLIVSAFIASALLLATAYYSLKPYMKYLWKMQYVGFDFWTFIKDITPNINILDFNYATLILALLLFTISMFILYYAHRRTREPALKHGKISFFFFIFFYFFLLGFVWMDILIRDVILRKKQRW